MVLVVFVPQKKTALFEAAFTPRKLPKIGTFEAVNGTRTRDLRLTKATLYRLSHSSNFICEAVSAAHS